MVIYSSTEDIPYIILYYLLMSFFFLLLLTVFILFIYSIFKVCFNKKISSARNRIIAGMLCSVICAVTAIGAFFTGRGIFNAAQYDYNMTQGNYSVVQGDVKLLNVNEVWGRYGFEGYSVKIKIDNIILEPSNAFTKNIVETFESNKILYIKYGNVSKEELSIWQIEIVE